MLYRSRLTGRGVEDSSLVQTSTHPCLSWRRGRLGNGGGGGSAGMWGVSSDGNGKYCNNSVTATAVYGRRQRIEIRNFLMIFGIFSRLLVVNLKALLKMSIRSDLTKNPLGALRQPLAPLLLPSCLALSTTRPVVGCSAKVLRGLCPLR